MRDPGTESTDDELLDWFIAALNREHRAREIRDGVIEIVLESGRRVELLLTREQLREAAWSDDDIFDDTDEPFVRSAVNPVIAGLRELLIYADEELSAGLREGELRRPGGPNVPWIEDADRATCSRQAGTSRARHP